MTIIHGCGRAVPHPCIIVNANRRTEGRPGNEATAWGHHVLTIRLSVLLRVSARCDSVCMVSSSAAAPTLTANSTGLLVGTVAASVVVVIILIVVGVAIGGAFVVKNRSSNRRVQQGNK